MSLKLESSTVKDGLTLMVILGVLMVAGSIVTVAIGSVIDHSWILTGINYVLPVFISGCIIIWVGVKVLEIMK